MRVNRNIWPKMWQSMCIVTVTQWVPFWGPGSPWVPFGWFGSPLGPLFMFWVPFFNFTLNNAKNSCSYHCRVFSKPMQGNVLFPQDGLALCLKFYSNLFFYCFTIFALWELVWKKSNFGSPFCSKLGPLFRIFGSPFDCVTVHCVI